MKKINIIHLSDLHYNKRKFSSVVDLKDRHLSRKFKKGLEYGNIRDRLKSDLPKIMREIDTKIDLLAFTGDLCNFDARELSNTAIQYLIELGKIINIDNANILVAPGNHDMNREKGGNPLLLFERACKKSNVSYCQVRKPLYFKISDIPIFCINSSMGSREIYFPQIKRNYWGIVENLLNKYKSKIIKKGYIPLKFLGEVQSLDIPAIGHSQMDFIENKLNNYRGNLVLVISHHCPLPTPDIEVRPYGTLIDSGEVIYSLTNPGRKIILLHGHKHVNNTTVMYPMNNEGGGLLFSNGVKNFEDDEINLAHIEIKSTDDNKFLCCSVERYSVNLVSYEVRQKISFVDTKDELIDVYINIEEVKGESFHFQKIKEKYPRKTDDEIAENLLKLASNRYISIKNMTSKYNDWQINKRIQLRYISND